MDFKDNEKHLFNIILHHWTKAKEHLLGEDLDSWSELPDDEADFLHK